MHAYCLISTCLVWMVCIENVVVYMADARDTRLRYLKQLLQRVTGSSDQRARAMRVLRAMKIHLRRKRAREAAMRQGEDAAVPASLPATANKAGSDNRVAPFDSSTPAMSPAPVAASSPPPPVAAAPRAALVAAPRRSAYRRVRGWLRKHVDAFLDSFATWAAAWLDIVSWVVFPTSFALLYYASLNLDGGASASAAMEKCGAALYVPQGQAA